MPLTLKLATDRDVADLVSLHTAVHQHLDALHGHGYWSSNVTEKGVRFSMTRGNIYIARQRGKLIAALTLSTRKPWAIDKKYFHPSEKPLYLTAMQVHPAHQGKGIGARCIDEARKLTAAWPADAIRLDAWAEAVGAGDFYRKCGFQEVGRATYRVAPLIYFEMLIVPGSSEGA